MEFALIAPFLLVFIFAIVDFGIGINHRVIITNAAREAARYGATGQSVSAIQQRAIEQSEGLISNPSQVTVQFFDVDGDGVIAPGDSVAVQIHYSYSLISPLVDIPGIPTSLSMDACTDMRLEQVTAGATPAAGSTPCQ